MSQRSICESKFRYISKYAAMLHLKRRERRRERIKKSAGNLNGPLRPYRCPICYGYHLTSQPLRNSH